MYQNITHQLFHIFDLKESGIPKEVLTMPVRTAKIGGKHRVVETGGRIARTSTGKARDGGGHVSKAKAVRQVRAINSK